MSAPMSTKAPGEPAPRRRLLGPEVIGPTDCPLLHRWTLLPWGSHGHSDWPLKVMVHHFLAQADDRVVHDHPRGFWTLVLKGCYDDMAPCSRCRGTGRARDVLCYACDGKGVVLNERMRAGMLRHRPASHRHRTRVSDQGCWTIVLMGPVRRRWGFWRGGEWWFWREHERQFGFGMRCGEKGEQ